MSRVCFLFLLLWLGSFQNHVCQTPPPQLVQSVTPEEQRAYIKIETIRGTPTADIHRALVNALGGQAYSDRRVRELSQEFRELRRTETSDKPRSGRPVTATSPEHMEQLQELMVQRDGLRAEDVSALLNISEESVRRMLHELGYHYILAKWLPHELTCELKHQRVETAQRNLEWYGGNSEQLDRIIAIDETWIRTNMPTYGQQARSWVMSGDSP